MNCERSTECGFYKILVEREIVQKGDPCVKAEPEECPRHKYANGIQVNISRQVYRVHDVLKEPLPLGYDEIPFLYPNKESMEEVI
jgi:hypothetical protein